MSTASERTIHVLEHLVKRVPIGTNLSLLYVLWAIISGAFRESRGGLFPALRIIGLCAVQIRRCGQALRRGSWTVNDLVERWNSYVRAAGEWQARSHAGYRPVAADLTTFWRPRLRGWLSKFYHQIADRACKGIGIGLVVQVGQIGSGRGALRAPLVRTILCCQNGESETDLQKRTLIAAGEDLNENEVLLHDAGASIAAMQEAHVPRYVVRLPSNCTARQNVLPEYKGTGRYPEYGHKVRPLPRTRDGNFIPETPPDVMMSFFYQERRICIQGWLGLVRTDQKVNPEHETFNIWAFFDPDYENPWLLGTNLTDVECQAIFHLFHDRWPVEQVPLVAKQTLGLERQFVFAKESCLRLPALALLAANVATHLAAMLPPLPLGFWDTNPQRTAGRLQNTLKLEGFPEEYPLDRRLREKMAVTSHLPKGIAAHRRQKVDT